MKNKVKVFLLWLCIPLFCMAQDASMQVQELAFVEGKQYLVLPPVKPEFITTVKGLMDTVPKGQVSVLMFFNYGCPICNAIEPKVSAWYNEKAPQKLMAFVDVPVTWDHPNWREYARAFYIAQSLNVLDKGHHELFQAIHGNGEDVQPQDLSTKEAMRTFFHKELGVQPDVFDAHYDTFDLRWKMKQGDMLMQAYGIQKIPAFVVAGKYYTDVQLAGGLEQLVNVVNFLVNKETFTKDAGKIDFNAVSSDTKVQ